MSCLTRYEAPGADCEGVQETAIPTGASVTVLWWLSTFHEPPIVNKLPFHNKSAYLTALAFEPSLLSSLELGWPALFLRLL